VAVTVHNPTGISLHDDKLYYVDEGYESIYEATPPDMTTRILRNNLLAWNVGLIKAYTNRHRTGEETLSLSAKYAKCSYSVNV
jgi:hypothetical protein